MLTTAIIQRPASEVMPGDCVRVGGHWTTVAECGQVGAYIELIATDNTGATFAPSEMVEIAEGSDYQ